MFRWDGKLDKNTETVKTQVERLTSQNSKLDATDAQAALKNTFVGTYLIRPSTKKGAFTVSVKGSKADEVKHFRFYIEGEKIRKEKGVLFANLDEFLKEARAYFHLKSPLEKNLIEQTTGYTYRFKDDTYEKFKHNWNKHFPNDKSVFDDGNALFKTPHSWFTLLAITIQYPDDFSHFFGASRSKNLFTDYYHNGMPSYTEGNRSSEQTKQLLAEADDFFDHFRTNSGPLSDVPLDSEETIIRDLLQTKKYPGIILGESHDEMSSKKFLIENMQVLKNNGVTTLYLEHLLYGSMQSDLDAYLVSNESMPPVLETYLADLDWNNSITNKKWGFKALVQAAKEAGIRVVAIDTEASYNAGLGSNGSEGPDRFKGIITSLSNYA